MKTELVRIGNSRGVRIPKPFIEQCGLGETVELRVANDCLIISPGASHARAGTKRSAPQATPWTTNSCWRSRNPTSSTIRTGGGKRAAAG